jgi:hypothetical protein
MAIDTTKPNIAKEAGGNLDIQTALLRRIDELVALNQRQLAQLKAQTLILNSMQGHNVVDASSFLTDEEILT